MNEIKREIEGEIWLKPDDALHVFLMNELGTLAKARKEGLPYRRKKGKGNGQYEYPKKLCQAWFRGDYEGER